MTNVIPETELILNPDGSVYHLNLRPENIGSVIILVGDQGRVEAVSKFFDFIDFKVQNREFLTHTGSYKGKRISVISSGIGTDNMDIVMNELDAVVNIDLNTRSIKEERKSLHIVRIGTSGTLQENIPVDSFVVSSHALGFDGLLNYYLGMSLINDNELSEAFIQQTNWSKNLAYPYAVKASDTLTDKIGAGLVKGITATAPGFYGPQGRKLRLAPWVKDFNQQLAQFKYKETRIINFEMETSALYGLGRLLGHETCTVCSVIANRVTKQFSKNYHLSMDRLIQLVLERLTQ
jgi:uridine phosphorylase